MTIRMRMGCMTRGRHGSVHHDGDSSWLSTAAQALDGEQYKSEGQWFWQSSPSVNLTEKSYRAIKEMSVRSLPPSQQSWQEISGYPFPFHSESMKWQTKVKYFAEWNELVGLFWKFTQEHNLWTFQGWHLQIKSSSALKNSSQDKDFKGSIYKLHRHISLPWDPGFQSTCSQGLFIFFKRTVSQSWEPAEKGGKWEIQSSLSLQQLLVVTRINKVLNTEGQEDPEKQHCKKSSPPAEMRDFSRGFGKAEQHSSVHPKISTTPDPLSLQTLVKSLSSMASHRRATKQQIRRGGALQVAGNAGLTAAASRGAQASRTHNTCHPAFVQHRALETTHRRVRPKEPQWDECITDKAPGGGWGAHHRAWRLAASQHVSESPRCWRKGKEKQQNILCKCGDGEAVNMSQLQPSFFCSLLWRARDTHLHAIGKLREAATTPPTASTYSLRLAESAALSKQLEKSMWHWNES